jgi:transcriptional regulator with XRE-family HTH domain
MTQSYVDGPTPAAALLQLARLKAGLSQRQLAERVGVPTTMISAYERDRRQPTLPTLLRLLRAAGFELTMRLEPYETADEEVGVLDSRQAEKWSQASPVVEGEEIVFEDLDDVIRSKELAGRPKDLRVLPTLYRFRLSRGVPG